MLKLISTIFIITLGSFVCQAQIENINSSIKVIGTDAFYLHEVLDGQEIEMISEAYGASIESILASNPKIRTGLESGMILKIPFSASSAERMSQIPAPDTARANRPLEEAVKILQDEAIKQQIAETKSKASSTDDEEGLAQLAALSQSISEGISALTELKEVIEETPTEEEAEESDTEFWDTDYTEEARGGIGDFLDDFGYLMLEDNDSISDLQLKEYFIVRLNENGQITNVKDERTYTNANSKFLEPKQMKGHLILENEDILHNKILPLGLHFQATRFSYSLKVKKDRIRVLNEPLFVEHFEDGNPHNHMLRIYADDHSLKGKCEAVIVETKRFVSFHNAFEYNPFGLTDTLILVKDSAYVERMFSP